MKAPGAYGQSPFTSGGQISQVIIQDLPDTVTENFLKQLVNEAATPREIIIRRKPDASFGSRCFAFVRFDNQSDCERVIADFNYTKLDGKPIRIMLVDPMWKQMEAQGVGNLFVKGLDTSIEDAQLHDAFATFGEIISCKIVRSKGISRGFGYVQFRSAEAAATAKEDLKDATINNKKIEIEFYRRRKRGSPDETYTNIYVKNLPDDIRTDQDLAELFRAYGEVQSAKVLGQGGAGFCNMVTHEAAVAAVRALNGMESGGKVLYAGRAMSKAERQAHLKRESESYRARKYNETKDRNLYVKGLPEELLEEGALRKMFGEYGQIEEVKVPKNEQGRPHGFAYILFSDDQSAARCIRESVLLRYDGRQVHVAKFVPLRLRQKANMAAGHGFGSMGMGMGRSYPLGAPPGGVLPPPSAFASPGAGVATPQVPLASARDRLRQAVQDRMGTLSPAIAGVKALSEDQAKFLLADTRQWTQWLVQWEPRVPPRA